MPVTLAASNFLIPNGTFIAELIAFLLILGILGRYVWPRLNAMMSARQETIRRQLEEGQEARDRLAKAEREYRELIDQTRAESNRIREEARAEGQHIIAELRERAQEEADRVRRRGEEQLAAQREQVVAQLRAELGRLAVDLAERIVGESLTDDERQRRIVDRFIADLERQEPAGQERAADEQQPAGQEVR
jgi:F-type H+-transporting ATPase subunit b